MVNFSSYQPIVKKTLGLSSLLEKKKYTCTVVASSTDYNPVVFRVVSLQFQWWRSNFLSVKL